MANAIEEVASNENIGLSNLVDNARDNFAATKVKDFLQDTKAGRKILEGLNANPISVQYQEAIKATVLKKLEFLGLDISKVNITHYSAKESKNTLLADIKNVVDVQGLTITKGKDTGTILLDASGNENNKSNKTQDVKVAGHEAGEIKYLQNGNGLIFKDSYDTKEAMNDSSGNSFYNRLNEAANGNLTDVTYDSKSNDYVNSGTIYSNNVQTQKNGIEYRKLVPEDHLFIKNNTKKYAEIYNISEKEAKQRLVLGSRTLVDTQDNIMINKIINKTKTNTIMTKNELTQTQGFIMKESLGLTYMDGIDNSKVPLMTQPEAKKDNHSYLPNTQDAINPDIVGAGAFLKIGNGAIKFTPSVFNSGKTILNKGIATYDTAGRQTSIFVNSTVKPSINAGVKRNQGAINDIEGIGNYYYNKIPGSKYYKPEDIDAFSNPSMPGYGIGGATAFVLDGAKNLYDSYIKEKKKND